MSCDTSSAHRSSVQFRYSSCISVEQYKVWLLYCYIRVCDLFISLPLANWFQLQFPRAFELFSKCDSHSTSIVLTAVGFKGALVSLFTSKGLELTEAKPLVQWAKHFI